MPTVHEGIGTWYWGKTNMRVHRGVCEHCHRTVDFRSYDTTKYFVIFFIPIFPLGRRHIIDQCPRCSRHRAIKLSLWEQGRSQALAEAAEALRREPNNVEVAKNAIAAAVAFQDATAFDEFIPAMGQTILGNAGLQAALGATYEVFGRPEEAEQTYRTSLSLADDPEVRESLAMLLLRQGRPDEAWPFLQHVLDNKLTDKMGLPLLAAESYQSWGMHEEALAILDDCLQAFPQLEQDGEYRRMRAVSEKNRSTGKPIKSQNLAPIVVAPERERRWAAVLPRLVLPILLGGGAVAYLATAYVEGRSREVFVVNGLAKEYRVDINGVSKTLPPMGRVSVRLPEGDVAVKVLTPDLPISEQTCRIATALLSRPFKKHTFIINPDRSAMLRWREITYSEQPDPNAVPPRRLYVGQLLTDLTGLDYVFQEFPDEVKLSGRGSKVLKRGVMQLRDLDYLTAIRVIVNDLGKEAAVAQARRLAEYEPQEEHLGVLMSLAEPAEVLSLVRPMLPRRPVLVDAHRYYQDCIERTQPGHDLAAEYRTYLERDAENPDLLYLLGRATMDADQAERLYQQATHARPPSPYAYNALAYKRLANAHYEQALDFARKAIELAPGRYGAEAHEMAALSALGRFDEVLVLLHKHKKGGVLDVELISNEIYALVRSGKVAEAQGLISQMFAGVPINEASDLQRLRDSFTAQIRYAQGDLAGYLKLASGLPSPTLQFDVAVSTGKLDDARKVLEKSARSRAYGYMLLHLKARSTGNASAADDYLKRGAELLRKERAEERRAAEWLIGSQAPDPAVAVRLDVAPAEKTILMTAMGLKFPQDRERYFDAARRLNYDTRFPYLLLNEILKGALGAGPP